jgi:cytochrome c
MTRALLVGLVVSLCMVRAALSDDAAAGAVVFKKCMVCHAIGPDAVNKIGPELNGVVGRAAGSVPSYNYSQANKSSGIVWSEEVLSQYLRDPRGVVPGTKMTFPGLKSDEDIGNVIAYLMQFGLDGKQTP